MIRMCVQNVAACIGIIGGLCDGRALRINSWQVIAASGPQWHETRDALAGCNTGALKSMLGNQHGSGCAEGVPLKNLACILLVDWIR